MKTRHWLVPGIIVLISLILEFTLLSGYDSHWWNSVPAFYLLWGLFSCVVLIYLSRWLGSLFLYKDENYYDH